MNWLDRFWTDHAHSGRRPVTVVQAAGPSEADVRAAYKRGRKDERARHPPRPLLSLGMILLAAAGAVVLFLAAQQGSFGRGGAVVDTNLAVAADRAEPVVRGAADDAGRTLRGAGEALSDKAAAIASPDHRTDGAPS